MSTAYAATPKNDGSIRVDVLTNNEPKALQEA
jgi:hypothetical protein